MNFTERLNKWIKENGIKQIDIAQNANVTKGYVSNVVTGKTSPSNTFLQSLSKMTGKSVYYWLYGNDETVGLTSLNKLIDSLIDSGDIKKDGTYDKDIELIIKTMLNKEIRLKLENNIELNEE